MILKDNSEGFPLVSAIYKCDIKKLYISNIQIFFCQLRPNANMKNFVNQTIRFVFLLAFQRCFCQSHNPPLSASLEVWRKLYHILFLLFSLIMFIYNVTFCTFLTIFRLQSLRSRGGVEKISRCRNPRWRPFGSRVEEIEASKRESSSRRRKRRRARRKCWLPVRAWMDITPKRLRGGSTSTPLKKSHDATLTFIAISLLPNNFKSRDTLIYCDIYL